MNALSTNQLIENAVNELLSDWKVHDEDFFQTNGERVVSWHVAKIRSYLTWAARPEIKSARAAVSGNDFAQPRT